MKLSAWEHAFAFALATFALELTPADRRFAALLAEAILALAASFETTATLALAALSPTWMAAASSLTLAALGTST